MSKSPCLRDPAIADLKLICFLLNGGGELPPHFEQPKGALPPAVAGLRPELRRLVAAWRESGPDGESLLKSDSSLARRLERMTVRLVPTPTGRFRLEWPSLQPPERLRLPTENERWQDFAFGHFANLLLNPYCEMLGGPCARCGRYYIKNTVRQKVYCSRRCDNAAGAVAATRKRLQKERAEKLSRAQGAAGTWRPTRKYPDWKQYVSRTEHLTLAFLTRAVRKGELQEPRRGDA
jgi:hypothetical protein